MSAERSSLSVVLPFHNEEENVESVVGEMTEALRGAGIPYELVCVDSGSTDATGAIVARLAAADPDHVVPVPVERKGYGLAVLRGLAAARKDWVSVASGDGQVDPADVVKAYERMAATGADLVKPRRTRRDDGAWRRVVSFACSLIMKTAFGLPGWDFMAPPKVWRRSLLGGLALVSEDRFIDTELLVKSRHLGLKIVEVGVVYRKRLRGEGKVSNATIVEYLRNLVDWKLHYRERVTDRVRRT
jgi:dolichol-phosphate mannosyltransferase